MPADPPEITPPALPVTTPNPGLPVHLDHLEGLAETARDYAKAETRAEAEHAQTRV